MPPALLGGERATLNMLLIDFARVQLVQVSWGIGSDK